MSTIEHWRAIKGLFYSLLITGLAAFSIAEGRGAKVVIATAATIVVVTSLEVKEIQFLNALSITFFRDADANSDADSESDGTG